MSRACSQNHTVHDWVVFRVPFGFSGSAVGPKPGQTSYWFEGLFLGRFCESLRVSDVRFSMRGARALISRIGLGTIMADRY